MALQFEQIF